MTKKIEETPFQYEITSNGGFLIKNYNLTAPFASFLPGIAGVYGIPMWVFYVNRAQCISSLGVDTKDKSIVEFSSANRAYQYTPTTGFRTFYKINQKDFCEPFQKPRNSDLDSIEQTMEIQSYGLTIEETNRKSGIKTRVSYFTIPNEPIGVFGRKVTITNIGGKPIELEVLDGLPQIVTEGLNLWLMKHLTNLTEAWALVEGVKEKSPFYKIKVEVKDTPDVSPVKSGNFYLSRVYGESGLSDIIIDPKLIFGIDEALLYPELFAESKGFKIPDEQRNQNLYPSAFSYNKFNLKPSGEVSFASFTGNARNLDYLEDFKKKSKNVAVYAEQKMAENRDVVRMIEDDVMTLSNDKKFDYYTRLTYLDNVLRGGVPHTIGKGKHQALFYLYSRKHGDMERDYNFFKIPPTYFSQGNGNYRDVNQNRRSDVLIHPDVGESALKTFMNLIQMDGYNPLVINGTRFFIENASKIDEILAKHVKGKHPKLSDMLKNGFTPGEILLFLEDEEISLKCDRDEFISNLVGHSERYESANHHEGFWTDHWTYNLDLVESYLSVYPERLRALLLDDKTYTYYESFCHVVPRTEKYFLTPNGVRQYHSVKEDKKKEELLMKRVRNPFAIRHQKGKGEVYKTNLFEKLLVLALTKTSALDPEGVGIEFEANKPNWYDALNGISGLVGSSISETFELKRLLMMMGDMLNELKIKDKETAFVPAEVAEFLKELTAALDTKKMDSFNQWDLRNLAKEKYRASIKDGIDGARTNISFAEIRHFMGLALSKIEEGIKKSIDKKSGLPFTYFINEVKEYEILETASFKGLKRVMPLEFKQIPLALFLEGVVHGIRSETSQKKVLDTHKKVQKSDIYDKELKMYKVNASIEKEMLEIGRTKAFPAGWLENESVWLHMEYKYLLELLKKGLYEEFFLASKSALVPNLDPKVYGRSILENSSFIVSSAYYDKTRHGRGFYARLSGSTAEFINMWIILTVGQKPFQMKSGELVCKFSPILPAEFFTTKAEELEYFDKSGNKVQLQVPKNSFVFKFLGSIPVVYHNTRRLNTWEAGVNISQIVLFSDRNEKLVEIHGDTLTKEWATKVRDRDVGRIEISIG